MSAKRADGKRRWGASILGAGVVMGVFFALLALPRIAAPTALDSPKIPPAVEVAPLGGNDRTLEEATIMHDQTPLFLPTERNVTLSPLPPLEAGGSLLDRDDPKLSFGEQELTLRIPAPVNVPENPAEATLTDVALAPLHGLGRLDAPVAPLPARGAVVEVFSARDNARVLPPELLPLSARPPTEKTWRPMEFAAAVEPAGLVGSLVVTERSDAEEVERYFRNYLAHVFRIGERLPPGFYRIVVGP